MNHLDNTHNQNKSIGGFRLKYLQVYNWGLYNNEIFTIRPELDSALLIGANGSGKSTLVDSILTLFLSKPKFNLAGDATKKNDRDLVSYVRGAYSNKTNSDGTIEPVYLRDKSEFSVILASFESEGIVSQSATLAQFFWFENKESTSPKRLYILSHNKGLDLLDDFEIDKVLSDKDFKNRLKKIGILSENETKNSDNIGLQTDKFSVYSNRLSDLFGLRNKDRALSLFNQTVSLKNVGDLNAFIRNEMLDEINLDSEIAKLKETFDAANRIADKIKDAERKLDILETIEKKGVRYKELKLLKEKREGCISAIPSFFSTIKKELSETEKKSLEENLAVTNVNYKKHFDDQNGSLNLHKSEADEIKEQISLKENEIGIEKFESEIKLLKAELINKEKVYQNYSTLCEKLELTIPKNEDQFKNNIIQTEKLEVENGEELKKLEAEKETLIKQVGSFELKRDEIENRLKLLKVSKTTLLDDVFIEARIAISERLNIPIQELPFVCELIQVKETEKEWQGSMEKLIKPLGLNLVVQHHLYEKIGGFISNYTFNNVKINFFKLHKNVPEYKSPANRNSVFYKLELKPDIKENIKDNLNHQIINHFDFICCSKEELFGLRRAITKTGLIKRNDNFHEKDDRKRSNNPADYILGWDNTQKVEALKTELKKIVDDINYIEENKTALTKKIASLQIKKNQIDDIIKILSFEEINYKPIEEKIKQIETTLEKLNDNSILDKLKLAKKEVERKIKIYEYLKVRYSKRQERLSNKIEEYNKQIQECDAAIQTCTETEKDMFFPLIKDCFDEIIVLSEQIKALQQRVNSTLLKELEVINKEYNPLGNNISGDMRAFCDEFKEEAKANDIAGEVKYLDEFLSVLDDIRSENLPQYKEDFDQKIREQTDTKMTDFRRVIYDEKQTIQDKIFSINGSLKGRHYEKNKTFIQIIPRETEDDEIKAFENELKSCFYPVGKQLTKEERDQENFIVFNNVKALLEKLELLNVADKGRWAKKVTDVRNWFIFSASERDINDPEREIKAHSGTAGQSGGETSKITYTILASAIAYQFGLDEDSLRTNSLRFVTIDEIFNNLGDINCHYVLQMFRDMNLQLLIVSPDSIEKVHITEKYVKNVHWTYKKTNNDQDQSFVINIDKEEMVQKLKSVG